MHTHFLSLSNANTFIQDTSLKNIIMNHHHKPKTKYDFQMLIEGKSYCSGLSYSTLLGQQQQDHDPPFALLLNTCNHQNHLVRGPE